MLTNRATKRLEAMKPALLLIIAAVIWGVIIATLLAALAGCETSVGIQGGKSTAQAVTEERKPSTTTQRTSLRIGSAPVPETATLRIWIPDTKQAECTK